MCILFNPEIYKPSDTVIIVAPVATPPSHPRQWQLVYINSMDRNVFNNTATAPPLMVLPIPNPHNLKESEFPLYPLTAANAHTLRQTITDLIKPYAPPPPPKPSAATQSFFGMSHPNKFSPPLEVQTVGGYKICVAPTLSDLKSRAPWVNFSIPTHDVNRTLADMDNRYRDSSMAFVIAEGIKNSNIRVAGFGIGYCDSRSRGVFFPTSHEPSRSDEDHSVGMDVTCVAINSILRPLSIMPMSRYAGLKPHTGVSFTDSNVILRCDDSFGYGPSKWRNYVFDFYNALPRTFTKSINGTKVVQLEMPKLITMWKLEGRFPNNDVSARGITETDVNVTNQTFMDIDVWVRTLVDTPSPASLGLSISPWLTLPYVPRKCMEVIDTVLALLGRQLADPGICDRNSDVVNPSITANDTFKDEITRQCGPVTYFNLDIDNIDLDEDAYMAKEQWARRVAKGTVDTTHSAYVRISASSAPFESLAQRTVQPVEDTQLSFSSLGGLRSDTGKNETVLLFQGAK